MQLNYSSISEVASSAQLGAMTRNGDALLLQFVQLSNEERQALIRRLSDELPDHSVFASLPASVTLIPLVPRERVLARLEYVLRALEAYRRLCATLVQQYEGDTLGTEWSAYEHGEHCRFVNGLTGQVVEAPTEQSAYDAEVDPCFFAEFVESTAGWEPLAELIVHRFHDAARILEIVGSEGRRGAMKDGT